MLQVTRSVCAGWKEVHHAVLAFVLSGNETKTRAAGCDGYFVKPFSPRQLLAAVIGFLA
jgi:two-component system, cell cycle response regulator DivK